MEEFGKEIAYPTIEQICEVNRRMIEEFGGLFVPPNNLLNLDALEYILSAIKVTVYGREIYSTLKEKASAIAYYIISRHVFILLGSFFVAMAYMYCSTHPLRI